MADQAGFRGRIKEFVGRGACMATALIRWLLGAALFGFLPGAVFSLRIGEDAERRAPFRKRDAALPAITGLIAVGSEMP